MCSAFQVEREFLAGGMVPSDHLMLHTGSLLQADGAFLILDTRDILAEPGAWKGLVRTLRIGRLALLSFYPGVPHPLVPQPAAIPRATTELPWARLPACSDNAAGTAPYPLRPRGR